MHSPADTNPLSPADQAYALERAKLLVATYREPESRAALARQIFEDAFTRDVPQAGAVRNRNGFFVAGHARRDSVPDQPPPPREGDDERAQLEQALYLQAQLKRSHVVADNARKLRALLWARNVLLDAGNDMAESIESAIREWFQVSLPELPRDTAGIEQCVQANARASWATLARVKRERESAMAAE